MDIGKEKILEKLSKKNYIIDISSILSYNYICHAVVAELADALDSGSSARKGMEVQVLSTAPIKRFRAFYR